MTELIVRRETREVGPTWIGGLPALSTVAHALGRAVGAATGVLAAMIDAYLGAEDRCSGCKASIYEYADVQIPEIGSGGVITYACRVCGTRGARPYRDANLLAG
jgi:hypothetical protein